MKKAVAFIMALLVLSPSARLHAQDRDIKYMTSGGKLHPLEIITDAGIKKIILGKKQVIIKSRARSVIDAGGNYFKKFIAQ